MNNCKGQKLCCTKINNLSVKIDDKYIIKDINLHLHCSEITAIVGPNGAGKSTLLKAILQDVKHTGSLTYKTHSDNTIKKPILGYVPQTLEFDRLYPMSVFDLLYIAARQKYKFLNKSTIKNKIYDVLKMVDITNLANRKIGQLSGGELQRVVLALALIPMPDILLLDEPVSGVDQNGLKLFYSIVSKLRVEHDMTIILVSHDFKITSKYANKVILINKEIVKQGTPKEVFYSNEFINLFGEVDVNV